MKILEGFFHRAIRRITGMIAKCVAYGTWEYPLVVAALESVVLYPIHEYIWIRQAIIAAQVACRSIHEFCAMVEWRPGKSQMMIWSD